MVSKKEIEKLIKEENITHCSIRDESNVWYCEKNIHCDNCKTVIRYVRVEDLQKLFSIKANRKEA